MAVPTPEGRPAALRPGTALVVALAVLALASLLAVAVYLAGQLPWDGQPPAEVVTTPDAVVAQPDGFYGRTVTVTGTTTRVIGVRVFTVGEGAAAGDELLVVSARPIPEPTGRTADAPMATEDVVRLTGEVHPFDLAWFEQQSGADLDDRALLSWQGRPTLLARTVEVSPKRAPAAIGHQSASRLIAVS